MTLKDKNNTDKIKDYFLDPWLLEHDLYDNSDLFKEISWSLKVHLLEFMNPNFEWFSVLFSILEREPVFIQDFLNILEKKTIIKGKRDEVKFISEIKPLIDHIWFNHNEENRYTNISGLIIKEIMNFNPSLELFKNYPNYMILFAFENRFFIEKYLEEFVIPYHIKNTSKSELSLLLKPVFICLDNREWRSYNTIESAQSVNYDREFLEIDQFTFNEILKTIFRLRPSIDIFKSEGRFMNFLNHFAASDYISQLNIKHPYFCDVSEEEAEILDSICLLTGKILIHSPSQLRLITNYHDLHETGDDMRFGYFQKNGHVSSLHLNELKDIDLPKLMDVLRILPGFNHLKMLSLNNNDIYSLPENFGNIPSLVTLKLKNNKLKQLPSSIGNLKSLKSLDLYKNNLEILPSNIGNLESLEILELRGNSLETLPVSFWNLKNLKSLDLARNRIIIISNSISDLSKLEHLYLNDNKLQTIPDSIGNFSFLTEIHLYGNEIDPDSILEINNKLNVV